MFQLFPAITKAHRRNYGQTQSADAAHPLAFERVADEETRDLLPSRKQSQSPFPDSQAGHGDVRIYWTAKSTHQRSRLSTGLLLAARRKPLGQRNLRIRAKRRPGPQQASP